MKKCNNLSNKFNYVLFGKTFQILYYYNMESCQSGQRHNSCLDSYYGELSERSNVPLSKSGKVQAFGGSNPPLSAKINFCNFRGFL